MAQQDSGLHLEASTLGCFLTIGTLAFAIEKNAPRQASKMGFLPEIPVGNFAPHD
jgi:hypothetical protein